MSKMTDSEFLQWILDRLHFVHNEKYSYDYMLKLSKLVERLQKEEHTQNLPRS